MSALRDRIGSFAWFLAKMGVREKGGQNQGEVVSWILRRSGGRAGQPWCVAFLDTLIDLGCESLGVSKPFNAGLSCSALYREAKERGLVFTDWTQAKKGDLILLKGGATGHFHVGMVWAWVPEAKHLLTVEGNTNSAGSAEGDGIYWKKRSVTGNQKYDFVRIES